MIVQPIGCTDIPEVAIFVRFCGWVNTYFKLALLGHCVIKKHTIYVSVRGDIQEFTVITNLFTVIDINTSILLTGNSFRRQCSRE
ncbi:hypothetical protein D3C86_1764290 [compost metagenome]